ncbi:MAG: glutamate-5-semialdehyde dehydrogenase [Clostridiales bacterium]|jgi:glutamate-5-semialdehyde dehydrogenase|nr:glutamate-5-semialdehyde dehydrogenase [Clostridiales bacterium]
MSEYISDICKKARAAAAAVGFLPTADKNRALELMAAAIGREKDEILRANALDVSLFPKDKNQAFLDRLTLDGKRIESMADGVLAVAGLDDPIGKTTYERTLPNGLELRRVRAPLGVVAIIYESRPNVTADAAALCFKSGNACVLRGGKEAVNTNKAIYTIMKNVLFGNTSCQEVLQFIDKTDRAYAAELLTMKDYIDVVIPRGGNSLKDFVLSNAKMPVIASAGGVCHVYVEQTADFGMASDIIFNAKTSRPGVCNAAETLLVDEAIADRFLPDCLGRLSRAGVEIRGDERTIGLFDKAVPVKDYDTEYEALILAVKVVKDYNEAIDHINAHNTKHSDAIVTGDERVKKIFAERVDAAAVYINASTRFTDGFEFGLGAEMAISTQKLHVRGPMGLEALTSEKYVVAGNGQVR